MDPKLILFAIESGVKLGREIYDVLVDRTIERPLLLPTGELFADIQASDAVEYFDREENRHLTDPGGPYHGFSKADKLVAYRTIHAIEGHLDPVTGETEAKDIVIRLHGIEQLKKKFKSKPPLQRILGTVVEIGIDYFVANPDALGKDSPARRIVHAFVASLDETDFSGGTGQEIVGDVLVAALQVLGQNHSLLSDDRRVQALLGGLNKALLEEVKNATSGAALSNRQDLFKRISSSLLKAGAEAFTENLDLFLPKDTTAKAVVQSTLQQVLEGIRKNEDLFTNESIEVLFKSALGAVSENAALFTDRKIVQDLIKQTVSALTNTQGRKLFSEETVAAVLREALVVVRDNAETLVDPSQPQQKLLAHVIAAVAGSLTTTSLSGNGKVKDILSKKQLVDLTKVVFNEVAKHPEQLLGANPSDTKKTALAQVVGSIARALGDDPARLVTGAGFVQLVQTALRLAVANADKLIDFGSPDTKKNVIYRVLQQIADAVLSTPDPRSLVSRGIFLDIAESVLPIVSANLDELLSGTSNLVQETVKKALELASGVLQNRINGANLPILIAELLVEVLWNELDLGEENAVKSAAMRILRAAA